jgi:hypothetical protein
MLKKLLKAYSIDSWVLILIIMGSVGWALTMIKSGLHYSYGIGFWGPNGHDGIWHLALINSISGASQEAPVFAGEALKNYHVGFDLLVAIIHRLTFVPVSYFYFQIIPPLFAVIIGLLSYIFVFIWRKSKKEAFWATFFIYFSGSFGYLYTLGTTGRLGGESLFWAQQSISTLINPPFALSLIFLLLGLIFLQMGIENRNKKYYILATFLFGVLIQIKIYAGLIILTGLFAAGLEQLLFYRRTEIIKIFVGSLVISILLFSNLSEGPESIIIFKPFWFLESLFGSVDRFYWPRFAEALINYKSGGVWLKGSLAYVFALLIFIIGNLGTRIISVLWLINKGFKISKYDHLDVMIITMILAGLFVPLFFVQSGTPWNTIQFFYYSLTFLSIVSGAYFGKLLENLGKYRIVTLIFCVVIIIFTLPTTIGTLWYNYLPNRPPAMISNEEFKALEFLKKEPRGIVLTQAFDPNVANAAKENPPRPLYLYESTAYVSAYADKPVYLEDEVNLDITGFNWQIRRREVERFFTDPAYDGKYELIEKKGIKYVYVVKSLQIGNKNLYLEPNKIFENAEVKIYKYD